MKINFFSHILCVTVLATSFAARAQSLSVKEWTGQLKSAVASKNFAEIKRLSDLKALEMPLFKKQDIADTQAMAKGRELYAQGKLDEALAEYNKIGNSSASWMDALEEKGWVYFRKDQPEKALAQTKTLLSDAFLPIVGSSPFFLQSLSNLKVCDYKAVLDTHQLFKSTQKARLTEIQDLADKGASVSFVTFVRKADRFPLEFKDFGDEVKMLPRGFYRDIPLQKALLQVKMANEGLPLFENADASMKSAPAVVAAVKSLNNGLMKARQTIKDRMKKMARMETDESFKVLQKLNLVEVETIQRVHADAERNKATYKQGEYASIGDDDLTFPDDGHPWVDELDKYQVKVNACPKLRRKM